MTEKHFDIVIVGAGPGGCACAFMLAESSLNIAIVDKSSFPRDKICGDALSADVINQLHLMDEHLAKSFEGFTAKQPSNGVRFFAPNHQKLDIDFKNPRHNEAAGYISKRVDFDAFMFDQIKKKANITVFENQKTEDIHVDNDGVTMTSTDYIFHAKMVIGADGAHSVVNKKLCGNKVEKDHYCAGLRQYYKGVSDFHPQHHIELHFYNDVLPGYFWIFPLPDGQANVGLGMLSGEVSKRKVNLKHKLKEIIETHPNVKDRFATAEPMEDVQGFGLPIGSKKRPISGNRFLLIGDAASLIDPFTGEGIGNALRSGRIAADHIQKAMAAQQFDAAFNKAYDKMIYHKMWNELRISRSMQKLLKYPKLFNYVVKKANKNESVRTLLTSMLDNIDLKAELVKPGFYWKLLFR